MINKIVAIQGNHPSTLNPLTDTSIFLANEIQKKKYKIFYYEPKNLSTTTFRSNTLTIFIITTIKTLQCSFFGQKSLQQKVQYSSGFLTRCNQNCDSLSRYLHVNVSAWGSVSSTSFQFS